MSGDRKVWGIVSRLPALRPETNGLALEQTFTDERNAKESFSHCMAKNPGVELWLLEFDEDATAKGVRYSKSSDDSAEKDTQALFEDSAWETVYDSLVWAWGEQFPGNDPE